MSSLVPGAVLEQHVDDLLRALIGGHAEQSFVTPSTGSHVRAPLEQQLHCRGLAPQNGFLERRVAFGAPCLNVGPGIEEQTDAGDVSVVGGGV